MTKNIYTQLSGTFVKIISPVDVNHVLKRNTLDRPEARYNRRGENALYLSSNENSARVAMQKYAKEIETPVVLVEYAVESCQLVDLRRVDAQQLRNMASTDWTE